MREWIITTSISIYDFIAPIYGIAFLLVFFLFIPLGLFKKTSGFASVSLLISSYVFGASVWFYSAALTFALLGWFWLIIGFFVFGLGVIPLAIFGTFFNGHIGIGIGVLISAIFAFGIRWLALYIDEKSKSL